MSESWLTLIYEEHCPFYEEHCLIKAELKNSVDNLSYFNSSVYIFNNIGFDKIVKSFYYSNCSLNACLLKNISKHSNK